jgi:membrane-associated HD superfamily phosphohydrolase
MRETLRVLEKTSFGLQSFILGLVVLIAVLLALVVVDKRYYVRQRAAALICCVMVALASLAVLLGLLPQQFKDDVVTWSPFALGAIALLWVGPAVHEARTGSVES